VIQAKAVEKNSRQRSERADETVLYEDEGDYFQKKNERPLEKDCEQLPQQLNRIPNSSNLMNYARIMEVPAWSQTCRILRSLCPSGALCCRIARKGEAGVERDLCSRGS
jgi:hypothetical protein